jgi:hypothetical protein
MLSGCNTWSYKWRKEEGTNKWTSKQQGKEEDSLSTALLAMISTDETEERPPPIPRTDLNPPKKSKHCQPNVTGSHMPSSLHIMDH